jgi:hypothetical protein
MGSVYTTVWIRPVICTPPSGVQLSICSLKSLRYPLKTNQSPKPLPPMKSRNLSDYVVGWDCWDIGMMFILLSFYCIYEVPSLWILISEVCSELWFNLFSFAKIVYIGKFRLFALRTEEHQTRQFDCNWYFRVVSELCIELLTKSWLLYDGCVSDEQKQKIHLAIPFRLFLITLMSMAEAFNLSEGGCRLPNDWRFPVPQRSPQRLQHLHF